MMMFTDSEERVVKSVFSELLKMPYDKLNTFLGSLTIQEMDILYHRLRYKDYCEANGISYEDMDEGDFLEAEIQMYEYKDSDDE